MVPFSFCGHDFIALTDAALFWPKHRALIVADLHLEKGSWFASHGQMLPPYDSMAAVERIEALAYQWQAEALWCLGDNFHDSRGAGRLQKDVAKRLRALTAQLDWLWITGNHDPVLDDDFGGRVELEVVVDGLVLRHEADPKEMRPELSGHYHPKYRVALRGRLVSRRCFVMSDRKIILPAFGTLTGGLDASHPELMKAVGGVGEALVPLSDRLLRFPIAA